MQIAHLDELLDVVGNIGAEIVAARAQFARGQLLVADVVEQQRLHGVDVATIAAVEFVLDDVEQTAVKAFDERQRFEIDRADLADAILASLRGAVLVTALIVFSIRADASRIS